jgi:hypothetical protein
MLFAAYIASRLLLLRAPTVSWATDRSCMLHLRQTASFGVTSADGHSQNGPARPRLLPSEQEKRVMLARKLIEFNGNILHGYPEESPKALVDTLGLWAEAADDQHS